MVSRFTLAIDYGAKYIGVALLSHSSRFANRVLYAGVLVVKPKPLKNAVSPRAQVRGVRRSKKTRRGRLRRLAQALHGIRGADEIVRYCRRRGYSYDRNKDGKDKTPAHAVHRDEFFRSLEREIERVIAKSRRAYVLDACRRHLNAECRPTAELRPARFENRHPSKCQWEGCGQNVPRKKNAIRELLSQTLFGWLRPVYEESVDKQAFRRFIEARIDRLVGLERECRNGCDTSGGSPFSKQKKIVFDAIPTRVQEECAYKTAKEFAANWEKTYKKQITEILSKKKVGRLRFCRVHSRQYIDYFLQRKVHPQRTEVNISDLFGRSQQIVFSRIWQLVSARLLPLCNGHIDRVVVERTAFDILGGMFKDRKSVMKNEDKACEMYWHGPMHGHDSRLEMFKEEFDGRCAYCGRRRALMEVEHILPSSKFPFDSYFNTLPACSECNSIKRDQGMMEAGMTVHDKAYEAYSAYVGKKRPPHLYHEIKKGMLNLMRHQTGVEKAQSQLAMLCNNLVNIGRAQQAPRPLARFLASRIEQETDQKCEANWISGRHTALYRQIALPEFDKAADKSDGGLINHAVDAIIMGCEFPSATAIENKKWNITGEKILAWRNRVLKKSPRLAKGEAVPEVEPIERLEHFENDLGNGYVQINLSAFNWNRQRQSGIKQDPYCRTKKGFSIKRKPADKVLYGFLNEKDNNENIIKGIAHRRLRALLEKNQQSPAREFVCWLQSTTRQGFENGERGRHPSDLARYAELEKFVSTPPDHFLRKKGSPDKESPGREKIPETIGVRYFDKDIGSKLGIARRNNGNESLQYYSMHPMYRAVYVGYRAGDDGPKRSKPLIFTVNQAMAVKKTTGIKFTDAEPVTDDPKSPLMGRNLGDSLDWTAFRKQWWEAMQAEFKREKIIKWFRITQGCYIEKSDGSGFQLLNFDVSRPWMKANSFRDICRVYRSPLQAGQTG